MMILFDPDNFAQKFAEDGMVVLQNFVSEQEVNELKAASSRILDKMAAQDLPKVAFSTEKQLHKTEAYFIESGDKVRPFFEEGVFDPETGELNRPINVSVNKIGHALHVLDPTFSSFTLGLKFRALVREKLGMTDPRVVQSMVIFKPPGVGGLVTPHRDESFLRTDPEEESELLGVWVPLDSALVENGCLWYVPGSHKRRTRRQFVRAVDEATGRVVTKFEGPPQDDDVPDDGEKWVPLPVQPGSCVLIHGSVLHKSEKNTSTKPRLAYTFHVADFKNGRAKWSPRNWLQLPEGSDFVKLMHAPHLTRLYVGSWQR